MHGGMDMLVCMRGAGDKGWARVAGHLSSPKLHTEVHAHLVICTRLDCRRPCGGPSMQRAEASGGRGGGRQTSGGGGGQGVTVPLDSSHQEGRQRRKWIYMEGNKWTPLAQGCVHVLCFPSTFSHSLTHAHGSVKWYFVPERNRVFESLSSSAFFVYWPLLPSQ